MRLSLPVSNRDTEDSDVTTSIEAGLRIVGSANDRRVVEEWFMEMPRADQTPYVRALLAAQDGALWVHAWAEGPLGTTWLRVEPDRRETFPVRVPFTGDLLDAGANWTLWRVQDEFGVDRVRLHLLH